MHLHAWTTNTAGNDQQPATDLLVIVLPARVDSAKEYNEIVHCQDHVVAENFRQHLTGQFFLKMFSHIFWTFLLSEIWGDLIHYTSFMMLQFCWHKPGPLSFSVYSGNVTAYTYDAECRGVRHEVMTYVRARLSNIYGTLKLPWLLFFSH